MTYKRGMAYPLKPYHMKKFIVRNIEECGVGDEVIIYKPLFLESQKRHVHAERSHKTRVFGDCQHVDVQGITIQQRLLKIDLAGRFVTEYVRC